MLYTTKDHRSCTDWAGNAKQPDTPETEHGYEQVVGQVAVFMVEQLKPKKRE
jgi:hypothetical protein